MIMYIVSNLFAVLFFLVFSIISIRGRSLYLTLINILGVASASLAILLEFSGSFILNMEYPIEQAQNLQIVLIFLAVVISLVLLLDLISLILRIVKYNENKFEMPETWQKVMEGRPYKMIFSSEIFNSELEISGEVKMTERLQALQMWKLANQAFNNADYDDAIEKYDLSNRWVATSTSWLNKSGICFEKGDFYEVIKCTEEATRLNSNKYELWFNRGLAYMSLNEFTNALQSFEEALSIDSNRSETYTYHGTALRKLGKINPSIESYDNAIKLDPEHLNAWYEKGIALTMNEHFEEAADCFRKTLDIDKKFAMGHYYLANTLNRLDWNEEAVESYHRCLKINPGYQEAWNNLGIAQSKLGKIKYALKSYSHAISINPDYQEAWLNRALSYETLKKYDLAIESYRNFLEIVPLTSNKHREIAQNHMNALKTELQSREKSKALKKKPRMKLNQKKQESKSQKVKTDPENIEA